MVEQIRDIFKKYKNDEILIFAHADHDGICASIGLNFLFGDIETIFSKLFIPRELPNIYNKKLFVICDLQLSEKEILYILRRGLEVINLDHHVVKDIQHYEYHCLNPKKIYGKQFISSSGLIWTLFKPIEISWILAVGSAGDLAIEDVGDLFLEVYKNFPELISGTDPKSIYNSRIFELAQILLMAFDTPHNGFELLKKCIPKNYNILYESELYKEYIKKQEILKEFLETEKDKIIETQNFVIINSMNQKYPGSYSVRLNLINKDDRVYIEHDNGRLFFRNYFGNEDIRNLSKLFGGSGAHARVGGGFTRKTFEESIDLIKTYYNNKSQKSLFDFSKTNV